MTFLSPWFLLFLLPVAALAVAYVVQQRRRSRYTVRFAATAMLGRLVPRQPRWRKHVAPVALLLTFGLLSLAAARPEMDVRVPRERATVIVALDTSLSMDATDVSPTRLIAASEAARTFIEGLPDTFDVGVVTFSGRAGPISPPSTDHALASASLEGLTTAGGTAIGEGIFASLDQVAAQARALDSEDVPARIVLLSDGRNTTGRDPAAGASAAEEAGVPVSTIAYGTDQSASGAEFDTETLERVAESTGGEAYRAADADQLAGAYDDIATSIGWRTEKREVSPYVAALALLLGLGGAALSLRWFSRLP